MVGGEDELSEDELIARLKAEFDAEEFEETEDRDAERRRQPDDARRTGGPEGST